MARKSPP